MGKSRKRIKMKCTDGYIYYGKLVSINKYLIEVAEVYLSFESNLIPSSNNLSKEPIRGPVVFERNNVIWFMITE